MRCGARARARLLLVLLPLLLLAMKQDLTNDEAGMMNDELRLIARRETQL